MGRGVAVMGRGGGVTVTGQGGSLKAKGRWMKLMAAGGVIVTGAGGVILMMGWVPHRVPPHHGLAPLPSTNQAERTLQCTFLATLS
jgi:hypothetical protein